MLKEVNPMKTPAPTTAALAHTALVLIVAVIVGTDIERYGGLWYVFAAIDFPVFFLALVIESPLCGLFENPYVGWVYVSAATFGLTGGAYWYFLVGVIQKRALANRPPAP